jgi:alpha-tubulin suppressor-like RCC1 family protein
MNFNSTWRHLALATAGLLASCIPFHRNMREPSRLDAKWSEVCAVGRQGEVRCLGVGTQGKPSDSILFVDGTRFRSFRHGGGSRCGVDFDGYVQCANFADVRMKAPACDTTRCLAFMRTPVDFRSVSVGFLYVCALDARQEAYCWGINSRGALGIDRDDSLERVPSVSIPTRVAGNHRFLTIEAGGAITCAIDTNHSAWCWGGGDYGQIGSDTVIASCAGLTSDPRAPCSVDIPIRVQTVEKFTALSARNSLTCGVSVKAAAYCWGSNYKCGLGQCDMPDSPRPHRISVPGTVRRIAVGGHFACALTSDDSIYCWGDNTVGQLGQLTPLDEHPCFRGGMCSPIPLKVPGGIRWRDVSANERMACALSRDEAVYCWGDLSNRILSNATAGTICVNRSREWKDAPCAPLPVMVMPSTKRKP